MTSKWGNQNLVISIITVVFSIFSNNNKINAIIAKYSIQCNINTWRISPNIKVRKNISATTPGNLS